MLKCNRGVIRNLLTCPIRQGRSADPFLLTNGIFEKFHDDELSAEKTAHASTKESLAALEAKHRDIDREVSLKVAEIAAQSGVSPIEADANGGDESIEDLAKRIDEAQGVEKAKLIEANYDRIISALKGVC